MDQQSTPMPMKSPTMWVALVAIVTPLLIGGWYYFSKNKTSNTNNSNQIALNLNQNNNSALPVKGQYSRDGISFNYPTYLKERLNYLNELDSTDSNSTLQTIRVTRLSSDFLKANNTIESYVENAVIEFPGSFSVKLSVNKTTVNNLSVVSKEYSFAKAVNTPDRPLAERIIVATSTNQHLLIQITGKNNNDFGVAISNLLQSLVF